MNGMWLIIFWIALICSVHSRPQNVKFDDSTPDVEFEEITRVPLLPFNEGGKRQSSQIIQSANGSVTTNIVKTPEQDENNQNNEGEEVIPSELEKHQLPLDKKFDDFIKFMFTLSLHDKAKRGELNAFQQKIYEERLDEFSGIDAELEIEIEKKNPDLEEYRKLPFEKRFDDLIKFMFNRSAQNKAKRGQLSEKQKNKYQEEMDEISETTAEPTELQEKNSDLGTRKSSGASFERKNELSVQKRINKTNEVDKLSDKYIKNNQTKNEQGKSEEDSKKGEYEEKEYENVEKKEENAGRVVPKSINTMHRQ